MSDGMTEANREMWRAEAETKMFAALADHVEAPSDATWHKLTLLADECDAIRGGHFTGQTRWATGIRSMVTPLLEGDEVAWAGLLSGLLHAEALSLTYGTGARLKALSPFAGKIILMTRDVEARHASGGETAALEALALETAHRVPYAGRSAVAVIDPAMFNLTLEPETGDPAPTVGCV